MSKHVNVNCNSFKKFLWWKKNCGTWMYQAIYFCHSYIFNSFSERVLSVITAKGWLVSGLSCCRAPLTACFLHCKILQMQAPYPQINDRLCMCLVKNDIMRELLPSGHKIAFELTFSPLKTGWHMSRSRNSNILLSILVWIT